MPRSPPRSASRSPRRRTPGKSGPAATEPRGLIILGMGKFGAGELNYSSDIDLIVLFDPRGARARRRRRARRPSASGCPRGSSRSCRSAPRDGYVFRTDLRLRPDPGATSIAISTQAALHYYESLGQNWERAALIKARAVAGDIARGRGLPPRARPLHLAQIPRLRRDRRHPLDQAADPRASRPRRGRASPATTSSSAAAASARSSSSSRRSS